jgi:hypothetical protein
MLGSDPKDDSEKGIAHIKSNCGLKGKVVGFNISDNGILWNPDTHLTADMIQGYSKPKPEGKNKLDIAKDFLKEVLRDGEQLRADILHEAMNLDISERTVNRAKTELGIIHQYKGYGQDRLVAWQLPSSPNS